MPTITKRDLIIDLSNTTGQSQEEVANVLEAFAALVSQRLGEGKNVALRTFGTFEICVAKSKLGRNPNKPNQEIVIPDRCVVRFRPSKELRQGVGSIPPDTIKSPKDD